MAHSIKENYPRLPRARRPLLIDNMRLRSDSDSLVALFSTIREMICDIYRPHILYIPLQLKYIVTLASFSRCAGEFLSWLHKYGFPEPLRVTMHSWKRDKCPI